jgi:ubiquinone/menaquinone biosynthesis C-methylase UbiE
LNLPHYPPGVELVGVDLTEEMLEIARKRAAELGVADRVELHQGDVQALDLPDSSVDTVLSTFTFCAIPDPGAAAKEVARVLRPGGKFVLAEHGRSSKRWMTAAMRGIEKITIRFDADHLTRDPRIYIEGAGFVIEQTQRSKAGIAYRLLAHKPG